MSDFKQFDARCDGFSEFDFMQYYKKQHFKNLRRGFYVGESLDRLFRRYRKHLLEKRRKTERQTFDVNKAESTIIEESRRTNKNQKSFAPEGYRFKPPTGVRMIPLDLLPQGGTSDNIDQIAINDDEFSMEVNAQYYSILNQVKRDIELEENLDGDYNEENLDGDL